MVSYESQAEGRDGVRGSGEAISCSGGGAWPRLMVMPVGLASDRCFAFFQLLLLPLLYVCWDGWLIGDKLTPLFDTKLYQLLKVYF